MNAFRMAAAALGQSSEKSKCDTFLEFSERSSDSFTIRMIDEIIHELIRKPDGRIDTSPGAYRKKQERIIEQIKGCEVAIFNDPRIKYGGRPHLSGITGALSNILTGTFYYLYYNVIQIPEIKINVKADLITLFYTGILIDFSKLPPNDNRVIQNIITILLEKAKKEHITLFTPDWWDSLLPKLESIITRLDRTSSMWRVFQELFGTKEEHISIFNYAPYEDTVDYIKHDIREYEMLLNVPANFDKIRGQLTMVQYDLFTVESSPLNNVLLGLGGGGSCRRRKKMTHRLYKNKWSRPKNGKRKTFRRRA
jgi:hypothetical protein